MVAFSGDVDSSLSFALTYITLGDTARAITVESHHGRRLETCEGPEEDGNACVR